MGKTILEFLDTNAHFLNKQTIFYLKKIYYLTRLFLRKKSILLYRVRQTTWATTGIGLTYQNKQSILNNVFLRFL